MKKILSLALVVIMCLFAMVACNDSGSDLEYVKDKGVLVVGITDYAPMDYKDKNGEWTGFDAEFARAFAKDLGVEVEFVEINWDRKFEELNAKTIDCIWNGMTITDEVTLNTSCSNAYVKNAQVLVMAADKIANYTTIDSIKGLKIAVENESAGEKALTANNFAADAYVEVDTQAKALLEVKAGTVDACVIDITMAKAMTGEGTEYANLAFGLELTTEEYGIGFRKDSDLTAKINEYMTKAKADGSLQTLADKYKLNLAD